MAEAVHLEGTTLEGGGQLVRLALGISALTATPIRVTNIRGNRSGGGGLKQQHLTALNWLIPACKATADGAERKSRTLVFTPCKEIDGDSLYVPSPFATTIDIGSPGAISLVFQALLPFLLLSGSSQSPSEPSKDADLPSPIHLTIKGGTNVSHSPSVDYLKQVLAPTLALIGIPPINITLHSRGWTMGTNEIGTITFAVQPLTPGTSLRGFNLTDRGDVTSVQATVLAPRQAERDFQREIRAALSHTLPGVPVDVTFELSGHPKRLYLLLVATTSTGCKLGRDWLYDRRITSLPAAVAQMVTKVVGELDLELKSGAAVDEYMSDQLVVFQALANGTSVVNTGIDENGGRKEGSLHAQTAWWVVQKLLGVEISPEGQCQGVGLVVGNKVNSSSQSGTSGIDGLEKEMEKLGVK